MQEYVAFIAHGCSSRIWIGKGFRAAEIGSPIHFSKPCQKLGREEHRTWPVSFFFFSQQQSSPTKERQVFGINMAKLFMKTPTVYAAPSSMSLFQRGGGLFCTTAMCVIGCTSKLREWADQQTSTSWTGILGQWFFSIFKMISICSWYSGKS